MRPSTFDPARAGLFSSRRGAMSCLAALVLCTQGAFASPPQGAAQRRAGAVAEPSAATRDVPGVSASHASDARSPALTLEEAVALAVDDAPSLAARRAGRRAAEARVAPSEALPDPELMFGLDNLPITGTDAGRFDEMTMRRVGVMQAFPRKAKRAARGALARAVVERRRSELASERSSVRERAALAWIDASLATAKLERLQDLGPILDAQVAAADAAIAAGRGMVADAISARSVRAALRQRAFDAEADAARARARLARWLPHDWDRALAPPPDTAVLRRTDADVLGAVARHRELAAYDARVREASAELELARQDKRPDWSLELSYGDRDPAFSDMVSVGVRIDLPIFAARRQDPLIAAKRAAIDEAEAEREDALREHAAELRAALAVHEAARLRLEQVERELLPLAAARVDAALAAYRGGGASLAASLAAASDLVELELESLERRAALWRAWAELEYAFVSGEE